MCRTLKTGPMRPEQLTLSNIKQRLPSGTILKITMSLSLAQCHLLLTGTCWALLAEAGGRGEGGRGA